MHEMGENSGGFDGYLYYHGIHFEKAYKALETIAAPAVLAILETIRAKFPKKRIPKTEDALQNTLDAMEERGVNFEQEDEVFYCIGVTELLSRLLAFILENKQKFR